MQTRATRGSRRRRRSTLHHLARDIRQPQLMLRQHRLFLEQGAASLSERQAIGARLAAIRKEMADDFPLDETGVTALQEGIAEQVLRIHDIEAAAVEDLKAAMGR